MVRLDDGSDADALLLTSGFSTWACGYFSQQISNSFQQLYTRHMAEFGNVWREIATR